MRRLYSENQIKRITKNNIIVVCSKAEDTPYGVYLTKEDGSSILGTLQPSAETVGMIYCVYKDSESRQPQLLNNYKEYITIKKYSENRGEIAYSWELIG